MRTHFMQMLTEATDLTDDSWDAMESDIRVALIEAYVRSGYGLVFSSAAAQHNYPIDDDVLYLGSHQCDGRDVDEPDSIYIELYAAIDESDLRDYAFWNITNVHGDRFPICYCPFCGSDLVSEALNDQTNDLVY